MHAGGAACCRSTLRVWAAASVAAGGDASGSNDSSRSCGHVPISWGAGMAKEAAVTGNQGPFIPRGTFGCRKHNTPAEAGSQPFSCFDSMLLSVFQTTS